MNGPYASTGYADNAIVVTVVPRGAVRAHWPGTDDGFGALARLTGFPGRSAWIPPAPERGCRESHFRDI
ncbi:hypothetical protein [Amycolatopsis roodepoortensis]|uniref:hypothetical protein n=1 Tax=Amycolatopsis roodepoortensis TaxID=700274 RepID=UPI0035314284